MNLNLKLEGEEEQSMQYMNRFAINIPSGTAAFNLSIVNPGLTNQGYILNPMNTVGQNIVTYQPPVALQSYIALPTETEGNFIHGLPVGVPVPMGLSVPTGLLPNNFVNTSIFIGNEDCNSSGVIKSPMNNLNPENEIKINFIEKPMEVEPDDRVNGIQVQDIGVNCGSQTEPETLMKKLCPLEMSIKAANIEMEFEKCNPEVPVVLSNCQTMVENISLEADLKEVLKVPLEVSPDRITKTESNDGESKKVKTEITWENQNKQESLDNGFQESLICEVEEANDDDNDVDDDNDDEDDDDDDDEEEEEEQEEEEEEFNKSSFEESDSLPLSQALKLNETGNSPTSRRRNKKGKDEGEKSPKRKKQKMEKVEVEEDEEEDEVEEKEEEDKESSEWSESDDDVLNLKRIKNEFNYKCYYEPNSTKSGTSLVLKIDNKCQKFVRVRSCCSKRECGKKISVQDQKKAYKNFYDLESNAKKDAYLMNCIEHVQKARNTENAKENTGDKYLEKTNIQQEIENESNGNQKLSDEIQKAINESLKDCAANEGGHCLGGDKEPNDGGPDKGEKNTWNFYIVVDRCRRKVCLQFLLKLFQITKSRIKQLQKKILSGAPTTNGDLAKGNSKFSDIWEAAKSHLDDLECSECPDCNANPRHRFLSKQRTKEDLFNSFKDFYYEKLGKQPNIKYASYKRFLDKQTSLSFFSNKEGVCTECEESKKHKKRKQSKNEKTSGKGKKPKESKKRWIVKTDSEGCSSDDEPLLKRKKLKLTIPLKAVSNKSQQCGLKRNSKKHLAENKSKGKSKQPSNRGRDVWSLMLLHLETMPFKECKSCCSKKKHRFLNSSLTTQGLFEDYRKYFLKETNSELGLGFTMYEKYFNRNCNYTIYDVDENAPNCPRCVMDETKS